MLYEKSALEEYVFAHTNLEGELDCFKTDCDLIIYLLEHCVITVPAENRFFVDVNSSRIMIKLINLRAEKYHEKLKETNLQDGIDAFAFTGLFDFSHTAAGWDDVISLGIVGLKNRLVEYSEKIHSEEKEYFYKNAIRVFDAVLAFIERASYMAREAGKSEMANGLMALTSSAPATLYEAMQTTIVYYVLQQMMEGTHLRTLGRLDSLYQPFLKPETDREYVKQMAEDFILEIDKFKAISNIPFAIGGTDMNGNTMYCEMSRILLDAYASVPNSETKLHILYNDNTPDEILEAAFEYVRSGKNSICFLSDRTVTEALIRLGEDPADAAAYTVVGCYECGAKEEVTCSCNARVNIPKAVEYALNNGVDYLTGKQVGLKTEQEIQTFADFQAEFERQLVYLCEGAMAATDFYEKVYPKLHCAPIMSATYLSAVENGGDIYCNYAAKYNNSSVNGLGLATATDSLLAIKRLVFEEKKLSLKEFNKLLENDWQGAEVLRLTVRNKYPKYGMADKEADALASNIVELLSDTINGKPNVKGGVYRLGMFSIDWRIAFGMNTGASADGRKAGEPLSQNTGASFGADREGVTANILSVTELDAGNIVNGSILDLDLHSSAVNGQNGMQMMMATLKTYFSRGGYAIHYNVLDAEVLKEAKRSPQKYPNLQVRLCGWNVLFSSLSEQAQNEFIMRAGNAQ